LEGSQNKELLGEHVMRNGVENFPFAPNDTEATVIRKTSARSPLGDTCGRKAFRAEAGRVLLASGNHYFARDFLI